MKDNIKRYCLALDLKNDPKLIAEYDRYHKEVWPEIIKSIKAAGIENMEIYRVGNRLFMIMDVGKDFSFEKKENMDMQNAKVQEWETLMGQYQQPVPAAQPGEKWVLMQQVFQLPQD